jgi:hypothetical protein
VGVDDQSDGDAKHEDLDYDEGPSQRRRAVGAPPWAGWEVLPLFDRVPQILIMVVDGRRVISRHLCDPGLVHVERA